MSVSVEHIRADAIAGEAVRTPTERSGPLSDLLGLEVFVKLETLQRTGSFKDRGALFKPKSLSPDEMSRGVIAISAGNHAQGVAYHAQRLGIPATIVIPEAHRLKKSDRRRHLGQRLSFMETISAPRNPLPMHLPKRSDGHSSIHITTNESSPVRAQSGWRNWKTCRTWTPSSCPSAVVGSFRALRRRPNPSKPAIRNHRGGIRVLSNDVQRRSKQGPAGRRRQYRIRYRGEIGRDDHAGDHRPPGGRYAGG